MSKQIVEIELLDDMYEYTVTINGIKRAISKSADCRFSNQRLLTIKSILERGNYNE